MFCHAVSWHEPDRKARKLEKIAELQNYSRIFSHSFVGTIFASGHGA
jgi:hypothetical protein